uniref:Setae polypeptide n=1 Tax=Ochrogaster lunifer TaxID=319761 RepID=A0AA49ETA8_OCHLU|nr:setae polypeptide [Ochrogaster lunifer]
MKGVLKNIILLCFIFQIINAVTADEETAASDDGDVQRTSRHIIDGPIRSCPEGQRKDSSGRCRVVLG